MRAVMTKTSQGLQVKDSAHRATLVLARQLSDAELQLLLGAGVSRELMAGEVIFHRGEHGRSMFVVESGEVRLEFGDGLPDKAIGVREFFGELALFIGNHTRVANAVASVATQVRVIENGAFESLLDSAPGLMAGFMRRSFAYLVASEQALIANLRRRNEDLLVTLDSLRSTQKQLDTTERLVQTDELTALFNRRGLYSYLEKVAATTGQRCEFALLLIDLDRFKQINDRYGHLMGDRVLRAVAREVQNASLAADLPCRLGGDEFALLLQISSPEELAARAALITRNVGALRFPVEVGFLQVTVSVGACICRPEGEWSGWYADADTALYEAKGRGGNGFRLYPSPAPG